MGETSYGMYKHPESVAREKYWLDTGKDRVKKDIVRDIKSQQPHNLSAAWGHYTKAASGTPPVAKALRRMGEICEAREQPTDAAKYYHRYLEEAPQASDRVYIENALSRVENAHRR